MFWLGYGIGYFLGIGSFIVVLALARSAGSNQEEDEG